MLATSYVCKLKLRRWIANITVQVRTQLAEIAVSPAISNGLAYAVSETAQHTVTHGLGTDRVRIQAMLV